MSDNYFSFDGAEEVKSTQIPANTYQTVILKKFDTFDKKDGSKAFKAVFKCWVKEEDGEAKELKKDYDVILSSYNNPGMLDLNKVNALLRALGKPEITKDTKVGFPDEANMTSEWQEPIEAYFVNQKGSTKYVEILKVAENENGLPVFRKPGEKLTTSQDVKNNFG